MRTHKKAADVNTKAAARITDKIQEADNKQTFSRREMKNNNKGRDFSFVIIYIAVIYNL